MMMGPKLVQGLQLIAAPAAPPYRIFEIFSLSIFARTWIDSSLRVIALLMAFRLMPLVASRCSFCTSSVVQACRWRSKFPANFMFPGMPSACLTGRTMPSPALSPLV
jgi:hypothetical protein